VSGLPALPHLLSFAQHPFAEAEQAARLEWLESDGAGGGAAGTIIGANTRRSHGLVILRPGPSEETVVLLAHIDETVVLASGERVSIGCNFYPGAVHPEGNARIEAFSLDPWPVWRYDVGDTRLVKELFHCRRAGALILRYRIEEGEACLEIRPLHAARGSRLRSADQVIRMEADASEGLVAWQPSDDMPATLISFARGEWRSEPLWYYRTVYPRETEVGRPDREDLASPGVLSLPLKAEMPTAFACGVRPVRIGRARRWMNQELARRENLARKGRELAPDDDRLKTFAARLALATDAFVTWADAGSPLVTHMPAGRLHVRDALRALPLVAALHRRTDVARSFLRLLADRLRNGELPVMLPAADGNARSAPDIPLLFIEAVAGMREMGVDVRPLTGTVDAIIDAYAGGSVPSVRVEESGLVSHTPVASGTWSVGGHRGTAEHRVQSVAINALWFNATMRAARLHRDPARIASLTTLADRCLTGFASLWSEQAGHCVDQLDRDGRADATLRPGQLLAMSLPHAAVSGERARRATAAVESMLVTPAGVRTLAPAAPDYDGGERAAGDEGGSGLRGAVVPALIGAFVRAHLRAHGADAAARRRAGDLVIRMEDRLRIGVAGHLASRAAGDSPHAPAGALASLWSLTGVLEAISALRRAERGEPV
jgi:predicted glycogen debranching enzyme